MSDRWIRIGRYAVIVVGVLTAAMSYDHIRDWALTHGGDSLTAPLLPLGIDGAVVAFTLFMHQAAGMAQWLSRLGMLVAIGGTVAFNTAYGYAHGGVASAVGWSLVPILLVICIEVSVLTVRKPGSSPAETSIRPVVSAGEVQLSQPVTRTVPSSPRLTVKAEAAMRRVSESTIYRERRAAKHNGRVTVRG